MLSLKMMARLFFNVSKNFVSNVNVQCTPLFSASTSFLRAAKFSSTSLSPINTSTIGFIGLGNMGKPMASHLVNAGYELVVFDLNNASVQDLVSSGAKAANSIKDLASQATCVISMLPASSHVESAYLEPEGILENLRHKNAFIIDCSTIGTIAATKVIESAENLGHIMVDAPVSGGVTAAKDATLTFMVGGKPHVVKECSTVLNHMGEKIVNCGKSGMGQAVKVCNNLLLATSMLAVSESYRLAISLGLDPVVFNDVVNSSTGRCWSSDTYNPVPGLQKNTPSSNGYKAGFSIDLIVKDLRLASLSATNTGVSLPCSQKTMELYKDVQEKGFGHLDFSCVYEHSC